MLQSPVDLSSPSLLGKFSCDILSLGDLSCHVNLEIGVRMEQKRELVSLVGIACRR